MVKLTRASQIINDAVKNLATLFQKKSTRMTVHLSIECLEQKLLPTGMALLPLRPLLSDGGVLSEHAFTPSAYGFGVFNPGDLFTTSNESNFSKTPASHPYKTPITKSPGEWMLA